VRLWVGRHEAMATIVWLDRIGRMYQVRWGSVNLMEKPLFVSDILDAMKREKAA
jgi:hypothetical protein